MAYQTLECDRRGGLAARERREELSDPVPVLCDPIEVDRSFLPVDHGVQRAIVLVWVNPIDPLAMKTANPRAEPLPEHGEGREVQLGVAMGVSVMLLRIDLGLVVEEPIQNVGCVPFRALDRGVL